MVNNWSRPRNWRTRVKVCFWSMKTVTNWLILKGPTEIFLVFQVESLGIWLVSLSSFNFILMESLRKSLQQSNFFGNDEGNEQKIWTLVLGIKRKCDKNFTKQKSIIRINNSNVPDRPRKCAMNRKLWSLQGTSLRFCRLSC